MFTHPEYDGHEAVLHAHDPLTGLKAIVALHNTRLGPAFGGCRMYPYADPAQALTDALRLSRGMTYKAAICELPYGGGKSVVLADPRRDKTTELLRAMGRVIEGQGGRYITADDVGTTLADLAVMREVTRHTAGATAAAQEPLAVTAYGVLMAIEAAAAQVLGSHDLAGVRVAVQGLGNVGLPLCRYLHERGAALVVADMDPGRTAAAEAGFGARVTAPEAIYEQEVEIFAPCALGAVLDDETIPRLRCRLVCGGANNQLAETRHDAMLAARGITFVPDYLANAGGVIDFYQETIDDRPEAVLASVERIRGITADVLAQAAATGETPLAVADRIVHLRLTAAAARYRMA
jgi:leucine dehydrogenase